MTPKRPATCAVVSLRLGSVPAAAARPRTPRTGPRPPADSGAGDDGADSEHDDPSHARESTAATRRRGIQRGEGCPESCTGRAAPRAVVATSRASAVPTVPPLFAGRRSRDQCRHSAVSNACEQAGKRKRADLDACAPRDQPVPRPGPRRAVQSRARIEPPESRHRVADPEPDGCPPRAPIGDGRRHEYPVLTRTTGKVEEGQLQPEAVPAGVALDVGRSGTHGRW